jgi:hypothetical protein
MSQTNPAREMLLVCRQLRDAGVNPPNLTTVDFLRSQLNSQKDDEVLYAALAALTER